MYNTLKTSSWINYIDLEHISVGQEIKHCGNCNNSSRVGWVGTVAKVGKLSPLKIDEGILVVWKTSFIGDPFTGISQCYTPDWFMKNIQYKYHNTKLPIGCAVSTLQLVQVPTSYDNDVIDKYRSKGNYIVWSPDGSTNPSKILVGLEEADRVCKIMSNKHNKTFYTCKLVSKAFQEFTRNTGTELLE